MAHRPTLHRPPANFADLTPSPASTLNQHCAAPLPGNVAPGVPTPGGSVNGGLRHPARLVPLAFLGAILVGTSFLMLPISRTDDSAPALLPSAFTAVSAVCVTGLSPVDPATFWTPFGQGVILVMIQVGGFGIMT